MEDLTFSHLSRTETMESSNTLWAWLNLQVLIECNVSQIPEILLF